MIVGITGYKGSGKSTAAECLIKDYDFIRVPFAKPLKDMLRVLGLEDVHLEGSLKEKPCGLLMGQTPRFAMQTLGTNWARDMIHPDIWVAAWKNAVHRLSPSANIVVDDLRFPNELDALHRLGGRAIRIYRPGIETSTHASENGIHALAVDHVVVNNETVWHLYNEIRKASLHEV